MKKVLQMVLVLPLVYSVTVHAEIYRWIDQNGVTHYSDVKPDKPNKKINGDGIEVIEYRFGQPETKQEETEQPAKTEEKPLSNKKGTGEKAQQKERHIKALRQAAKKDKCTDLRLQLAILQEKGSPVFEDDAGKYRLAGRTDLAYSGKRTYLSESRVAERLKTVEAAIKKNCSESDNESLQKKVRADWIRAEHCELSKQQLSDLQRPEARTANSRIKGQQDVISRYCDKLEGDEHRDDEAYYPQHLPRI